MSLAVVSPSADNPSVPSTAIINCGVTAVDGTTPTTSDTVYELGSETKVFTGSALAGLSLRGVVQLDDTLQSFLPQPYVAPANSCVNSNPSPITLRELATHKPALPPPVTGTTSTHTPAAARTCVDDRGHGRVHRRQPWLQQRARNIGRPAVDAQRSGHRTGLRHVSGTGVDDHAAARPRFGQRISDAVQGRRYVGYVLPHLPVPGHLLGDHFPVELQQGISGQHQRFRPPDHLGIGAQATVRPSMDLIDRRANVMWAWHCRPTMRWSPHGSVAAGSAR
ncbi:hypothetical protein BST37_00970 [Mycobacterium noviomagense]|uniref:Beta-lactamase-related domain-containing protein n=1 Tax=Mycobacterium noviomagense TaxID=459858 RepID=A0ABX3TB90_9MYCO|nr:hypothetical protein BST37_00970 [Mycobacterium noviomagense]